MSRRGLSVHGVLAVLASVLSVGADVARAADGDPEAGRRKTVTCNACHGQASMQSVPNLGGQRPSYFLLTMRAYQDGKRTHATMRDVAKAYTDKELKNFAAHYARFGNSDTPQTRSDDAPSGSATCEACHGLQGRDPVFPDSAVLAGQKSSYLKAVLREYRDGSRTHSVMQAAVAGLSHAELDALSDYFSQLPGLTVK